MDFLAADPGGEKARIHRLIRLRWVAVLGVLGVVVIAGPLLGLVGDTLPLFALVAVLAIWNSWLAFAERRGLAVQGAGRQVVLDLLFLGGLLFFSNGLRNPFAIFLAVQVMLGAILLPRRTAVRVGLAGAGIAVLLGVLEFFQLLPGHDAGVSHAGLPVWGVGLALVTTLGVALNLTTAVMEDLRARSREARLYHEQALREREKLDSVMRFVGASLVLLDRDLDTVWQNRHSQEVLGTLEEGAPFRLPDGEAWPPAAEVVPGRVMEREWQGPDARGRFRVLQISASAVQDAQGTIEQIVLVLTDITGRRAAEQQLHRTERLSALGRLAAGVAHEINTPLGSVSILTSEALSALPEALAGDPEAGADVREHMEDVKQETGRMTILVRRLLELSHPGGDGVDQPVDLDGLISDTVRLVSIRSRRSQARIRTELSAGSQSVPTKPDRLRQVLLNLIDNALDATRDGGGPVVLRTRRDAAAAIIEVEDDGDGIRREDLNRVFDPFFTTKDVGEGTGLGLYVSYEIMKNLGGDISIQSGHEKGTLVRVSLPVRVGGNAEGAPQ